MERTVISTTNAPGAIGPYIPGLDHGRPGLYIPWVALESATGTVPEGIAAQAEQSCKNVGAILEAAGVTLESVFKTTCFLADGRFRRF